MSKTYRKSFTHKGQMINYYNKLVANKNIVRCANYVGDRDVNGNIFYCEWNYR